MVCLVCQHNYSEKSFMNFQKVFGSVRPQNKEHLVTFWGDVILSKNLINLFNVHRLCMLMLMCKNEMAPLTYNK